jgi:hypothetical protein
MRPRAGLAMGTIAWVTRLHFVVAALVCAVLPAYSWLDGSGWLAWTMFSRSETYRMRVLVTDAQGAAHVVNPNQLAAFVDGETATYLSGTDHWRHAPVGEAFRANQASLAALACRCVPGARTATLDLDIRKTTRDAPKTSTVGVRCP